jgi:hypothetical protein
MTALKYWDGTSFQYVTVGAQGATGATGATGPQGVTGSTGAGVAAGGAINAILYKSGSSDYATNWTTTIDGGTA